MKNKNLLILPILVISLFQASIVFAEGPKDLINDVSRIEKRVDAVTERQEKKVENNQNNIDKSKKRVDAEINRRVNQLNKLLQRIENDQKLSADEKTNLSSDIQSDINGLTSLKTKVDEDTDISALRSDAKQVVTNFKINQITTPKTRLLITIDNLQSVVTKISGFAPKIQDLINNLKSEGKDVTQLQSLLDDVNARLTTINNQLSLDKTAVLGVTVSTTDPKSVFDQVRKDLANVRQSLAQIRHDFGQMRETFRLIITGGNSGNGSTSASPTPSASPTATPTSSPSPTPTSTP